jgi:RNA polymerase sigma-70 factor (ECF subfamily)
MKRKERDRSMDERDWLAKRFEENRSHLQAVAYRMLGSVGEADDALQEAWLRLSRSDAAQIENLGGWLTTVVARVCLDTLRSRRSRPEASDEERVGEPTLNGEDHDDPEAELLLADSVGPALLVVLETLGPAERVAFVLHDLFDVPFEEIAAIVGRSVAATRQLASRARRRVRGAEASDEVELDRKREIVTAFLAASRAGDFDALLELLDPEVELRADAEAVAAATANAARGAPKIRPAIRGARSVAEAFRGRARGAQLALVGGVPGATWIQAGTPRAAFAFAVEDGKIVGIEIVMNQGRLDELAVEVLDR